MFGNFVMPGLVRFGFDRLIRFSPNEGDPPADDDAALEDDASQEDDAAPGPDGKKKKKIDWTPELQAEFDRRAAKLKKDAADKARADTLAEVEATAAKEKEAADKKALEEQGKFKELAEAADKKALEAAERETAAKAELRTVRLKTSFDDIVEDMGLSFANTQAAADAYGYVDQELVGEDGAGMKKAIEKVLADRPHLFNDEGSEDRDQNLTDARNKGKRQTKQEIGKEEEKRLRGTYRIRTPR